MISQPRGLSGTPCSGHCSVRREQRLLHRVLGRVEVPVAAHQRAEDLRRQLAQQVLGGVSRHGDAQIPSSSTESTIGRTSTYSPSASGLTSWAAISVARSKLAHSTIV